MNNLLKKLYSIVRWIRKDPENFIKNIPANVLGLQIARTLWAQLKLKLRRYSVPEEVRKQAQILKTDGIIIIKDFLDRDVFEDIQQEWIKERAKMILIPRIAEGINYAIKDGRARIHASTTYQTGSNAKIFELLDKHVRNNDFIKKLASTVVHHKVKSFSPFQLIMHKKMDNEAPDLDSNIFFHPDVSFHGVKVFLYLNDIDTDNGAFTYAKGSHKLTWNRWKFEYLKSIRYARDSKKYDRSIKADPKDGRGWHCLSREEEKEFNVVGTPIEGKANTLIMFDVMGFHRRGDFANDKPRELVLMGFRG